MPTKTAAPCVTAQPVTVVAAPPVSGVVHMANSGSLHLWALAGQGPPVHQYVSGLPADFEQALPRVVIARGVALHRVARGYTSNCQAYVGFGDAVHERDRAFDGSESLGHLLPEWGVAGAALSQRAHAG